MYNVVYLWHGERHHLGTYSLSKAATLVAIYRANGWRAWIEPIS